MEGENENDIDSLEITGQEEGQEEQDQNQVWREKPAPKPVVKPSTRKEAEVDEEEPENEDPVKAALADLAKSQKALVEETRAARKPVAKQMSEAELKTYFKVYEPDDETVKAFFGIEPGDDENLTKAQITKRREVFAKVQQGLMQQAVAAANHIIAQKFTTIQPQIEEFSNFRAEAEARQIRQDFNTRWEALADPRFERLLRSVHGELEKSGQVFKTNEQYFDALAEGAAEYIRDSFDPNFDLGKPNKSKAGKMPKLSRSGVGGQGGGGGGGKPAAKKTDDDIDSLS